MTLPLYPKHPSDVMDIPINVINIGSNTISTATGTATAGITVTSVTATGSQVVALISGGSAGNTYHIEIAVTLSNGAKRVKEFNIQVRDLGVND